MYGNWEEANSGPPLLRDEKGIVMDAVAVGSILAVVGTLAIIIFLVVKIVHLVKTTHSEDG